MALPVFSAGTSLVNSYRWIRHGAISSLVCLYEKSDAYALLDLAGRKWRESGNRECDRGVAGIVRERNVGQILKGRIPRIGCAQLKCVVAIGRKSGIEYRTDHHAIGLVRVVRNEAREASDLNADAAVGWLELDRLELKQEHVVAASIAGFSTAIPSTSILVWADRLTNN